MRKVPSRLPLSISSACVRLILPTYHVRSSWWGRASSSSISEYWLWGETGKGPLPGALPRVKPLRPLQHSTHSSVSFLIPSHSLIFLCRAPFWVSHLTGEVSEHVQGKLRQTSVGSKCSISGGPKGRLEPGG